MLPNFVIIGSAKCATSSLRSMLDAHPSVFLAGQGKETRFFADDAVYAKGLAWYEAQFDGAGDAQAVGECSNVYTERASYPNAAARLCAALPHAKLIYMVREPLGRMESYWMQIRSHGGEDVHHDFNRALVENHGRLVASTNYRAELAPYRAVFAKEQILVVFFEDFRQNPASVLDACCAFLGIPPALPDASAQHHANPSAGKKLPPGWFSKLRKQAWFQRVRTLIPADLRGTIKTRLIFRRQNARPRWDRRVRAQVLEELREDAGLFLEEWGKTRDYWRLS